MLYKYRKLGIIADLALIINLVLLMGILTRDPELRYTSGGTAVASFGLAVNRKFKQGEEWKDEVCFVDITVWAKQGENCAEYLNKGSLAFIEGRLNYRTWEAEGGQKRSKLEVVANYVQFLTKQGAKVDMGGSDAPPATEDDIPF